MEPILSPLMIYFLVVKKGLSAKISVWCIPGLIPNAEIQNWRPKQEPPWPAKNVCFIAIYDGIAG